MPYAASIGFAPSVAHSGVLLVREPSDVSLLPTRRRVLLVADDMESLEAWALQLANAGVHVEVAPGADACLNVAAAREFDLLIIAFRLGVQSGLDVVRALRARGSALPFMLMLGHPSVSVTVDAMRLGARTVLEMPLAGDDLVMPVLRELQAIETERTPTLVEGPAIARRWAEYVLRGTAAEADPRTLADWGRAAGVSRSALIEACVRLGVNPRDARDLSRVLRLVRRTADPWDPEGALNVADRRTLRNLLVRAGLAAPRGGARPSPRQFLAMQRFVPQTNAGLAMLRRMLG